MKKTCVANPPVGGRGALPLGPLPYKIKLLFPRIIARRLRYLTLIQTIIQTLPLFDSLCYHSPPQDRVHHLLTLVCITTPLLLGIALGNPLQTARTPRNTRILRIKTGTIPRKTRTSLQTPARLIQLILTLLNPHVLVLAQRQLRIHGHVVHIVLHPLIQRHVPRPLRKPAGVLRQPPPLRIRPLRPHEFEDLALDLLLLTDHLLLQVGVDEVFDAADGDGVVAVGVAEGRVEEGGNVLEFGFGGYVHVVRRGFVEAALLP
mmetsp:Transcript_40349/g.68818  ORF Transcript_40349/g.68818 Transcript_40349/m.68818 type:complete len:261 (+) Transcript_40349:403-1185(+)